MDINLTTPALLFPAVSLLLLAFTNRFLALAALVRSLVERHRERPDELIVAQIGNLRYRITLIRNMQALGVSSLFLCVACMFLLFAGEVWLGKLTFGASLVLMLGALGTSILEILVSVRALDLQLRSIERNGHRNVR